MEPMVIVTAIAFVLFFYAGWNVYKMKKYFESRGGSYSILKSFLSTSLKYKLFGGDTNVK